MTKERIRRLIDLAEASGRERLGLRGDEKREYDAIWAEFEAWEEPPPIPIRRQILEALGEMGQLTDWERDELKAICEKEI